MALLNRLWIGMETRSADAAGTDDPIVLIVNQDGIDRIHRTFSDSPQHDQQRGQANLYEVDVRDRGILTENLDDSSFRIGIRGPDLWRPRHIFIWGEVPFLTGGMGAVPLAGEFNIDEGLSTDEAEGRLSLPLRRARVLSPQERLRGFVMMTTTSGTEDAGTESGVTLELTFAGGTLDQSIGLPSLRRGQATFFVTEIGRAVPGDRQPSRLNVDPIRLRIVGGDQWAPSSFFLFGTPSILGVSDPYDVGAQRAAGALVPLVHIPNWDLGPLSTEPHEGRSSVELPVAPIPRVAPQLEAAITIRLPGT
jgi:hypothetical protein